MTGLVGACAVLIGLMTNCAWRINGDMFELWQLRPDGTYLYVRSHDSQRVNYGE